MERSDLSPERLADGKEFHLKEFELLRQSHDALDARLVTIIQYLLLFSAAVYSYLLDRTHSLPHPVAPIAWSLPVVASIFGWLVLYGIVRNIKKKNEYFHELEKGYGYHEMFGWEHFKEQPGNAGYTIVLIPWIAAVIAGLNLAACIAGIMYISTLPPPHG